MDLRGRDLRDPEDLTRLDAFRCRNSFGCADDVEDYVRASAGWVLEEDGRFVKLFFDHEGGAPVLVGVVGFEWVEPNDPPAGAFISYIGVAATAQRSGIGSEIFRTILEHLADLEPGVCVSWRIHSGNAASRDMVIGVVGPHVSTYVLPDSEMVEYSIYVEPPVP